MTCVRPLFLLSFAAIACGCSSATNQAPGDGGVPEPDAGGPDGGTPTTQAECLTEGYPCSPDEVAPEVRALSRSYAGQVQERMNAGESFEEIAAWLEAQPRVVQVLFESDALRFRVEGGAPRWFYVSIPGIMSPPPDAVTAKSSPSIRTTVGPKRVIRENDSQTNVKKKALILEPFEEYIDIPTITWSEELSALHDYEQVSYFANRDVGNAQFANWNDYRFVWVNTHGKPITQNGNEHTILFSSRMCEEHGWLRQELEAGNGDELTRQGVLTLRNLFGEAGAYIQLNLTDAQRTRFEDYEEAENEDLDGATCSSHKMDWVRIPAGGPSDVVLDRTISFIAYDESWFGARYGGGLRNVFLYLNACSSEAVPVVIASGTEGAVVGWSDTVNSANSNRTLDVLFDRMIREGETFEHAFDAVVDAAVDSFDRPDGGMPTLSVVSAGKSDEKIRVREIVTLLDTETLARFPDEGGTIEARELPGDGTTLLDVTVSVVGFGKTEADEFNVQIFDGNDSPISGEFEVDEPIDGETFMTLETTLRQEIETATEIELEARVTLPEEPGTVYSKHPIKVTVLPAIESAWRFTVGGAGTARGDFINATSATAFLDDEGRLVWQLGFMQGEDSGTLPTAFLFIIDHPGRSLECSGPTGNFNGIFAISYTPVEVFGGGDGDGECGDVVGVGIESFSKSNDLVASVNGIICKSEVQGEEVVQVPVPVNGRFAWAAAGCGADPGGNLVKSLVSSDQPALCTDVYPNAAIAPAIDMICAQAGISCSNDPCPTNGQIGQCDYRSSAVPIGFRGQILHFGPDPEWPTIPELQQACTMQLGLWTTGAP